MAQLQPGDRFPSISVRVAGGEPLSLPDSFAGGYGVVLFLRGAWCPYCNGQLRAFQRSADALAAEGIRVAATWVDDEATTLKVIEKYHLGFPIGHDADAATIAAVTGAFVDPARGFLQSTGFVLDPEGRVVVGVFSSGAIGRLVPEDVIGLVRYERRRMVAAS